MSANSINDVWEASSAGISDDDCNVILQNWDETDPDQLIAIRLAETVLQLRDELRDARFANSVLMNAASAGTHMLTYSGKVSLYFSPQKATNLIAALNAGESK